MKRLLIIPHGWPCSIAECPPGHFLFAGQYLGFKSDYRTESGKIEVFNEGGEYFWGGTDNPATRDAMTVQPVTAVWEDYEE